MRKIVLIAAVLLAIAPTVDIKPAQAYPHGTTWGNAFTCGVFWKGAGKLLGDGGWSENQCWGAFYGM